MPHHIMLERDFNTQTEYALCLKMMLHYAGSAGGLAHFTLWQVEAPFVGNWLLYTQFKISQILVSSTKSAGLLTPICSLLKLKDEWW